MFKPTLLLLAGGALLGAVSAQSLSNVTAPQQSSSVSAFGPVSSASPQELVSSSINTAAAVHDLSADADDIPQDD